MANKETKSADDVVKLIEQTRYEYSNAIRKLRALEKEKMYQESRTTIILTAKKPELLKNDALKKQLETCFEDPKFKPTLDFIASCIYIEHKDLMEEYNYYLKLSKQAEKEFEMLSSQLIWHQSQAKIKGIELMNKI